MVEWLLVAIMSMPGEPDRFDPLSTYSTEEKCLQASMTAVHFGAGSTRFDCFPAEHVNIDE